jgi:hypothetical protein
MGYCFDAKPSDECIGLVTNHYDERQIEKLNLTGTFRPDRERERVQVFLQQRRS